MWTPKQSPNSTRPHQLHRPHRPHAHIVAPTVGAVLTLGMAARFDAGRQSRRWAVGGNTGARKGWLKKWRSKQQNWDLNVVLVIYCDYIGDCIRDMKNGDQTNDLNVIEYDFDIWFDIIWFTVNKQDWDITGAIRNIICKWWILWYFMLLCWLTRGYQRINKPAVS